MLIALQVLNNITTHRLLTAFCGVVFYSYHYQVTIDFEMLLEQKDEENTSKVDTLILLTIGMHIQPSRLLEDGLINSKYESKKKLCERCTGADCDDRFEIERAIATNNNNNDDKENLQEKNRQLKKEKQYLKEASA